MNHSLTAWMPPRGGSPTASARERTQDYLLAAVVGGCALLIYAATVQRTLSFWDCGEFIACSAILGIPHPPGTALFILLGRLSSVLPWPADIGLRVNLVSVLTSALAVSVGYLLLVRLIRRHVFPPSEFWGREWLVFVCSFCGAFLCGFGSTVWANATEAEVYGLTLLLFLLVLYLMAIWYDVRTTPLGPRLLILATFLTVLGLGVHMMVYLALPGLWLAVFSADAESRRDWRLWVAALATLSVTVTGIEVFLWNLSLVALVALYFIVVRERIRSRLSVGALPLLTLLLYGLFAWLLPLHQWPSTFEVTGKGSLQVFLDSFHWTPADWFAAGVIWVTCAVGVWWSCRGGAASRGFALPASLVLAALLAFSMQAFIPMRSAHNPAIDENNPDSWEGLKGFLERKQYGRESMITRAFQRRGEWAHQLGRHPRMGFWSFFETQWGLQSGPSEPGTSTSRSRAPAFLLLLGIGLWGAGSLVKLRPQLGWPLLLVLLISTLGLVVYMNFADGTRYQARAADQAYLEVRDRDYFFTTGFALFGLCVGLGVASFLRAFHEPGNRIWRPLVCVASAVFLVSLPGKTLASHYRTHDRSRNFVSYDYASNFLQSCAPGALLFTSGDNDTFPLWALQEAYGVRRDVRVINLSLANTHWYVRQAKERHGVPFDLPSEEIERLRWDAKRGRIQDQVINIVLESNRFRQEVYFGASTPEGSRVYQGGSLDSNLVMEGMVLRLVRERGYRMVDRNLVWRRYQEDYALRGLTDSTLYLDEATQRIADNYASALLFVADAYRRQGSADSAFLAAGLAARLRPRLDAPRRYAAQMAGEYNRRDVLDSLSASSAPEDRPDLVYNYGLAAELTGDSLRALDAYRAVLTLDPTHVAAFQRGVTLEYGRRNWDSLLALIDRWMVAVPEDSMAPRLRSEVQAMQSGHGVPEGAP